MKPVLFASCTPVSTSIPSRARNRYMLIFKQRSIYAGLIIIAMAMLMYDSMGLQTKDISTLVPPVDQLLTDMSVSFGRVLAPSLLAWGLALCVGRGLLYFHRIYLLVLPLINFIRHISPFAWLPFCIVWFGLGELPIFFVMFISLFFPLLIASIDNFLSLHINFHEEARVLGADNWQILIYIELPILLPAFIAQFRVAWGLGWSAIIAAEMLGVASGMGFRLLDYRYQLDFGGMIAYLFITGLLGLLVDEILRKISEYYRIKNMQ